MTDIRDYPNPLLKSFIESFGGVFDSAGSHIFENGKPSLDNLLNFVDNALKDPTNLHRLLSNGETVRPTLKVFYEGQTNSVFNSVLANDFVERAGPEAVSIDRTKLGQLLFRGDLDNVIELP